MGVRINFMSDEWLIIKSLASNRFRRIAIIVAAISVVVSIGIWMQVGARKKGAEHFREFNKAEIVGVIQSISIAYKGVELRVKGDSNIYIFYPYADDELNNSEIFDHTAKKGDSVIKRASADTLYLIKQDQTLKYTFSKFEY